MNNYKNKWTREKDKLMIKCTKDKFGTKVWRNSKGEVHRIKGHAVEYHDDGFYKEYGYKYWWYQGKYLSHIKSQIEFERWLKLKAFT